MLHAHLPRPSAPELLAFLRAHLHAGLLVQIAGEMEVVYAGRAVSMAEAGDYLLLVKPDGSVQVHGPRGVKPVNWQPRTDGIHAFLDDGRVVIEAERRSPAEVVRVTVLEGALACAFRLRDEARFMLQGSEAQMQAALARHPHLIEPGLTVLDRELLVGVGGVDLYARDARGAYVVVELKRGRATHDAVHQLARYVEAVRTQVPGPVRGILAAPDVTAPARTQLDRQGLTFVAVSALPAPEDEPERQPALF
ncbi:endonuclease NucS [Deinococcus maricopensis]|jgi:endonuclease|uniref:Endonuclease NucS n=1 Tax=Deinococcus maricopensis (strain DSM 21211 / LMG 22137 / NRRL B-23946 / LB-34) TaxID=709986 RepID=E8U4Y9_DEIML|nr:endonuclease NucS [Deinococcus maricopensis]ADV66128.1 UPF0286 protein [Deinococcus maricopensis DSM 21211]